MNETATIEPVAVAPAPAALAPAASEMPLEGEPTKKAKKAKKIKKSALPRKAAYFILYVPDMEQAVAFYEGTLKMKLGYQSPEWTEFKAGIKFALHAWSPSDASACGGACTSFKPQKTHLTFGVKDAGKSHEAFQALGIKVHELKEVCENGRSFDFEDPFGNTLSIYGK